MSGVAEETTAMVGISRQATTSVTGRPMLKLQPATVDRWKPRVSDPQDHKTLSRTFVQLALR
jgi:hypothetical protein